MYLFLGKGHMSDTHTDRDVVGDVKKLRVKIKKTENTISLTQLTGRRICRMRVAI